MILNRIKVSNFKSFDELDVEIGKFNVLIGANASGKSNFSEILEFIKDITVNGLNNAISMHGGRDYLCNINKSASKNLSIELHIDARNKPIKWINRTDEKKVGISAKAFTYSFSIKFNKINRKYKVNKEILIVKCDVFKLNNNKGKIKETDTIGTGNVEFIHENNTIEYAYNNLSTKKIETYLKDLMCPTIQKKELFNSLVKQLYSNKLFIEMNLVLLPPIIALEMSNFFSDISTYNFEPKLSKKSTPITGKTELESDGSNLAIVLDNILNDKKNEKEIYNLIKDILPAIECIEIERLRDESLVATLKEIYYENTFLPSCFASDGTLNVIALLIALYFEEKPLIIIEEPERNIHPHLISKVIDMMKDVAKNKDKQIIITTHNPEVVRSVGIENILFVHRDENGYSKITKINEKKEIKTFLQNNIGIDELYVQNLLEW